MLIKTEGLTKRYKKRYVVNGVNIEVNKGEIVGLIKPDAGTVHIGSTDVTKCPTYERAKYGVGYLPQDPSIFRKLSVEDNILAILETLEMTAGERKKQLDRLLDEFSITKLRKNMAYTLSGGERRRVEIARALVTNPSFLLLDEPFVGIDPITVADIQQVISQLKKKGLGILITDHNVRETLSVTDRAYIMYEGKILLSGDAKKLSTDKKAKEFYLGEKFTL